MLELDLQCEVCKQEAAVGVSSCMLAQPISVAYGENCLSRGIEAMYIIIGTIYCIGKDRAAFAPWALEIIDRSLEFHGLTWEEAVKEAFRSEEGKNV